MAQQIFDQYAPLAKVSANETIPVVAAIAQTRDGKDELLHGTVPFVPAGGLYVPISTANRLPVEATLTGQIVEEYNGGTVLRTKTEGLAYRVLRPFGPSDTSTVTVPAGGIVAQTADPFEVNGFSALGIICRDVRSGAAANNDFQVDVYWAGYNTRLTSRAVNEIIAPNSGIGVAVSLPTKSRYVWLRIRNLSAEDITYYCAAFLRA